jgi:hypothetical protein
MRNFGIYRNRREMVEWAWRCRRDIPPKLRLTFNMLHGVISQKIVYSSCENPKSYETLGISHSPVLLYCKHAMYNKHKISIYVHDLPSYQFHISISPILVKYNDQLKAKCSILPQFYYTFYKQMCWIKSAQFSNLYCDMTPESRNSVGRMDFHC